MKLWNGLAVVAGMLMGLSARGAIVNFTYSQTDATTGGGIIQPFTINPDGQGDISFGQTPLPAAVVVNPNPGQTPAGFIGAQTVAAGEHNEGNVLVGLRWSGSVTATGTRGGETYTIEIPLRFVPKQTQAPTDVSDYTWNVVYGDSPPGGVDTTSTSMRFGMWLSRDDVVDNAATANTFQRYTQNNHTFAAGLENLSNTHTTTTAVKDATDAGDPQGVDAAGRDLAFYYGWRDQGALSSGAILIDSFTVGGLLVADESTLVPEPSAGVVMVVLAGLLAGRRRAVGR